MKKMLTMLTCAAFFFGCDSVGPDYKATLSDSADAQQGDILGRAALLEQGFSSKTGDLPLTYLPDDSGGGCTCSSMNDNTVLLSKTRVFQRLESDPTVFTKSIGYLLAYDTQLKGQVRLALFTIDESICPAEESANAQFVRYLYLPLNERVLVKEFDGTFVWNGASEGGTHQDGTMDTSTAGSIVVEFDPAPAPPDGRWPTPIPDKPLFNCIDETGFESLTL